MRHYLGNGVVGYTYWNPILNGTNNGSSHWGWKQNSMITVHDGKATRTPEFYVFAHYAKTIKPGAVRLEVRGDWAGSAIVARNPPNPGSKAGDIAIVVMNPHVASRQFKVRWFPALLKRVAFVSILKVIDGYAEHGGCCALTPHELQFETHDSASGSASPLKFEAELEPRSFNSFLVPAGSV